jgi:alpha-glucosidase
MSGLYCGLVTTLIVSSLGRGLSTTGTVHEQPANGAVSARGKDGTLHVTVVEGDVVALHLVYTVDGAHDQPSEMMDPRRPLIVSSTLLGRLRPPADPRRPWMVSSSFVGRLELPDQTVWVDASGVEALAGGETLTIKADELSAGTLVIHHNTDDNLYGMRGIGLGRNYPPSQLSLLRNQGAIVKGGSQGDGGAPVAYTAKWGVFIDSVDGEFSNDAGTLTFTHGSRKNIDAYLVFGGPKDTMRLIGDLTGHPPIPPEWTLGFLNSQWKTNQAEVTSIIDEYRRRQIPIDGFIFDFDFKAWGEDDYGEFRWNSTSGAGAVAPNKYPDGASGKFAKLMAAKGIKLGGIMKPRILLNNSSGGVMKGAAEATAHNWWLPNKKPYEDYFSHRLANDLDFSKPDLRAWYWQHAKQLFDTGIRGWWNDEADDGFDSLGFFHMQQALYEGQRSVSHERVWSINRNFYLGAQRFGFGTWSGDIRTGFPSMAAQRARMLSMIDLGQSQWSMDSGGFQGHPSPENYARWIEFASVVPIMRVHNTYGEHRQPWVYGPIAEAAATKAIRWRYSMIPSLYSWENQAHYSSVGIVRPLFWEFPDDPKCVDATDSWMLGNGLLVSPVVHQGETTHKVYLPEGATWYDYLTDQSYVGGQEIEVPVDSQTWSDLPMFVREGTILASQDPVQYVGERPVDSIKLDVWPSRSRMAAFGLYTDDGHSYDYERGRYFSQNITGATASGGLTISLGRPSGRYRASWKTYTIRVHRGHAESVRLNGKPLTAFTSDDRLTVFTVPAVAGTIAISFGKA